MITRTKYGDLRLMLDGCRRADEATKRRWANLFSKIESMTHGVEFRVQELLATCVASRAFPWFENGFSEELGKAETSMEVFNRIDRMTAIDWNRCVGLASREGVSAKAAILYILDQDR